MDELSKIEKTKAGSFIALIGGLYGIFMAFYLFTTTWIDMYMHKAAQHRSDESFIINYIIPALHDLGVIGSILLLVAAYGFWKSAKWAYSVAIVGTVLLVQGSGFPIVAAASGGASPKYIALFIPAMALFYIFTLYVRKVDWKIVVVATLSGMAYVLCMFNGIAATSRTVQALGNGKDLEPAARLAGTTLYVAAERINWYGVMAWGIFTIGILLKRNWTAAGLFGGVAGIAGGAFLAYSSMVDNGWSKISLFALSPIFCIILIAILLIPYGERAIKNWTEAKWM